MGLNENPIPTLQVRHWNYCNGDDFSPIPHPFCYTIFHHHFHRYEVLDGQQRITSFARFVAESNPFSVIGADGKPHHFSSLPADQRTRVRALLADESVTNRRGIWEYVLGRETDTRLLEIRVFDRKTARAAYDKQTTAAKAKGESNCPLCATGHSANAKRMYAFEEMPAAHVTAWSKGGATDINNCQMLCKTHNAAKGNR